MQTPEGWIRKAEKLYRAENERMDRRDHGERQDGQGATTRTQQDSMIWLAALVVTVIKGGPYALLFIAILLIVRPR